MIPRLTATLGVALALHTMPTTAARASAPAAVALSVDARLTPVAAGVDSAPARAAFPVVPLALREPPHRHLAAYAALVAGAGLVAESFNLQDRADRAYDEYLQATDPDRIHALYERTTHYDRLSSGALIGGEALFAAGLWMRFLTHPRLERLALRAAPGRCALVLRY